MKKYEEQIYSAYNIYLRFEENVAFCWIPNSEIIQNIFTPPFKLY